MAKKYVIWPGMGGLYIGFGIHFLKEQSFISTCSGFCCLSKSIFFGLMLVVIAACVLSFPYNLDFLAYFEP